jgi:hypothetical protein
MDTTHRQETTMQTPPNEQVPCSQCDLYEQKEWAFVHHGQWVCRDCREAWMEQRRQEQTMELPAVHRYSVRVYSLFVDEYEVEAASEDDARVMAESWEYQKDTPGGIDPALDATVEKISTNEYVDHDRTCVTQLDDDGTWTTEGDDHGRNP